MPSVARHLLIAIACGAVAFFVVLAATQARRGAVPLDTTTSDGAPPPRMPAGVAAAADSLDDFLVANFALTDHNGEDVDPSVFDGEITALAFFFTRCPGVCPQLIGMMAGVERLTSTGRRAEGLRFAGISVDGDFDTPEVLTSYADRVGLGLDRWTLMTGDPADVKQLVRESVSFDVRPQAGGPVPGPDGQPAVNILHPTRVLLIGRDRRMIGTYTYTDPDDIERLIADAEAALAN